MDDIIKRFKLRRDIHAAFLDAGADIIATNTFNSTAIAMADYRRGLHDGNGNLFRPGINLIQDSFHIVSHNIQASIDSFL